MKILDLTQPLATGMPVFPGSPPARIEPLADLEGEGFRETRLEITSHTGTHVDAPAHMLADGRRLDDYGADSFMGSARCFAVDEGRLTLDRLERGLPGGPGCDFLLLCTGWDRYWGGKEYFRGYPVIAAGAAARLTAYGLKGIGVDCPSPDPPDSTDYPAHHAFMEAGLLIVENLRGLDRLPAGIFRLALFPLLHAGGDGAPARVIACLD